MREQFTSVPLQCMWPQAYTNAQHALNQKTTLCLMHEHDMSQWLPGQHELALVLLFSLSDQAYRQYFDKKENTIMKPTPYWWYFLFCIFLHLGNKNSKAMYSWHVVTVQMYNYNLRGGIPMLFQIVLPLTVATINYFSKYSLLPSFLLHVTWHSLAVYSSDISWPGPPPSCNKGRCMTETQR